MSILSCFWCHFKTLKSTKNEPPRLPLRLEGNPEGGVGTRCDSSPKARGYKKQIISWLRGGFEKGTHHTYRAISKQICCATMRGFLCAAGCRRRRRRSAAVRSAPPAGVLGAIVEKPRLTFLELTKSVLQGPAPTDLS